MEKKQTSLLVVFLAVLPVPRNWTTLILALRENLAVAGCGFLTCSCAIWASLWSDYECKRIKKSKKFKKVKVKSVSDGSFYCRWCTFATQSENFLR